MTRERAHSTPRTARHHHTTTQTSPGAQAGRGTQHTNSTQRHDTPRTIFHRICTVGHVSPLRRRPLRTSCPRVAALYISGRGTRGRRYTQTRDGREIRRGGYATCLRRRICKHCKKRTGHQRHSTWPCSGTRPHTALGRHRMRTTGRADCDHGSIVALRGRRAGRAPRPCPRPGRLTMRFAEGCSLMLYNIHNYDIRAPQRTSIARDVATLLDTGPGAPPCGLPRRHALRHGWRRRRSHVAGRPVPRQPPLGGPPRVGRDPPPIHASLGPRAHPYGDYAHG